MRIIGGDARGRTIVAPAGAKTRPTQDYVRESLFNIIRWDVEDARVLDLFAGTGALSLEALSRGARSAVLVDMDRAAGAAIRKNMETSRLSEKCRLIPRNYHAAMDALATEGARFDLVFIDPPYKMENTGEMCAALYDKGLLAEAFLLVVEHRKGRAPMLDARFEAFDLRHYGDTEITFVRRAQQAEEGGAQMDTLLYAGSFDPVTRGHMDVIRRAAALCPELVVAVMHNPEKHGFLPVPMRVELLKTACRGLNNVRVIAHGGLLIDCAHEVGAKAVIRGLRPLGDFESEYQMAQVNKRLGGVETLLMTTSDDCASISSSIVRQVAAFGGDISPMVPEGTAQQILAALSQK